MPNNQKNISDKKAVSKSLPDNPFASPQQLTFIGENEKPTLSIDSQFLYYISYNHRRHSHRQIYRMELGSRLNKRITFHDGDNYDIVLDPLQSLMYYSSTTDEIKEDSTYIKNALKKMLPPSAKSEKTPSEEDHLPSFPVTEIYRSQINGSHIERLTQSRKFDGHLTIHPLTGAKYFSSERAGHPQIFRMGKREKKFFPFHTSPLAQLYPQFSPDGKHLAYVEWDSKSNTSKIVLSDPLDKKTTSLITLKGVQRSLTWTPDSEFIVYSSNRHSESNFELYAIHKTGTCLKRLTYNLAVDDHPAFSRDGQFLYFASDRSGSMQIYMRSFTLPQSCINY